MSTVRHKLKRNERGNSILILYLGLFSCLMIFFGFAIDMSILNSARSSTQATLDSATVAGVTQLVKNKNQVNATNAPKVAQEFYGMNRTSTLGLRCMTNADLTKAKKDVKGSKLIKNKAGCGWVLASSKVSSNTYTMTTFECVSTVFMGAVKDEFCFFTSSTSRTSQLAN